MANVSFSAGYSPDLKSPVADDSSIIVTSMVRRCSRCTCNELATITLTYQYSRALVWIDDLTAERDPHAYDLCDRHGVRITAPSGWRLEDRRNRFRVVMPNRLAG
jgi:hypothetical protein